jgi:hypothetical protein
MFAAIRRASLKISGAPLAMARGHLLLVNKTKAAGSGGPSMQSLMHDQPQPTCNRPQNDGGESGDRDHHGGQ